MLKHNQSQLRFKLKNFIGRSRLLYRVLFFLRNSSTRNIVSKETDIVIEGFPRSGNSHFYNLVLFRSNNNINIASHLHVIAQISHAIKLNKPIVVLIREPIDTILSLIIMFPKIELNTALGAYIDYYRYVWQCVEKITIIDFKLIVSSPSDALNIINENYNLNINTEKITKKEFCILKREMKRVCDSQDPNNPFFLGLPSAEKRKKKEQLLKILNADINKNSRKLKSAERIYMKLTGKIK